MSKVQVHKCDYDHGGELHTPINIDICYGLIHPRWNDIVNPGIPSKSMLHVRCGKR